MTAIKLIESMIETHRKRKYAELGDKPEGMFFADKDKFYQLLRSTGTFKGEYRIRISEKQYYYLGNLLRKKGTAIVQIPNERLTVKLTFGFNERIAYGGYKERTLDVNKKELQIKYYA